MLECQPAHVEEISWSLEILFMYTQASGKEAEMELGWGGQFADASCSKFQQILILMEGSDSLTVRSATD